MTSLRRRTIIVVFLHFLFQIVLSSDVKRVLKGEEIQLFIQRPDLIQDPDELAWTFTSTNTNNKVIKIVKYLGKKITQHRNYAEGRVNFSLETYVLVLKNLQKHESGLYEAKVEKGNEWSTVAEYSVTVQDAVSPVHLTVGPVSSSPGPCNLTVICSSENSSVTNTFTCDNTQHCSQEEGGQSSEVMTSTGLLSLYVSVGTVICNHSNQVSMKNITKEIKPLCQLDSDHEDNGNPGRSHKNMVVSVCFVAGICGLVAVIGHRKRGKWNEAIDVPNTTYDSVQFQTSVPAMTNPDAGNGQHPEHTSLTIYSLLQHPPGSVPLTTGYH